MAGTSNARVARAPAHRFLKLSDVSEVLNISDAQAYALVRSGEVAAIKVGGRGRWRVETRELEQYITESYANTREFIAAHPFGAARDDLGAPDGLDDPDDSGLEDDDDPTAG